MLLYAFQDKAGRWHGDPDTEALDGQSGTGILHYQPRLGSSQAFAGQYVRVRYGPCTLEPSVVEVQLEDGVRLFLTWHVLELLEGSPTQPTVTTLEPAEPLPRPAFPPPRSPGRTRGGPRSWTPEEDELCRAGVAAGITPEAIAAQLGRSVRAVSFHLAKLRLQPFPFELVPPPDLVRPQRTPTSLDPNSHRAQVTRDHPRAYSPWTPEEEATVTRLARQGASVEEIACALQRQPSAITSRLWRLNEQVPLGR